MAVYLSDTIQDFLEYLEIEQNRSLKTIENYQRYLERLVEFAGDVEIKKIDSELLRKWRLWLNRLEKRWAQQCFCNYPELPFNCTQEFFKILFKKRHRHPTT